MLLTETTNHISEKRIFHPSTDMSKSVGDAATFAAAAWEGLRRNHYKIPILVTVIHISDHPETFDRIKSLRIDSELSEIHESVDAIKRWVSDEVWICLQHSDGRGCVVAVGLGALTSEMVRQGTNETVRRNPSEKGNAILIIRQAARRAGMTQGRIAKLVGLSLTYISKADRSTKLGHRARQSLSDNLNRLDFLNPDERKADTAIINGD